MLPLWLLKSVVGDIYDFQFFRVCWLLTAKPEHMVGKGLTAYRKQQAFVPCTFGKPHIVEYMYCLLLMLDTGSVFKNWLIQQ